MGVQEGNSFWQDHVIDHVDHSIERFDIRRHNVVSFMLTLPSVMIVTLLPFMVVAIISLLRSALITNYEMEY